MIPVYLSLLTYGQRHFAPLVSGEGVILSLRQGHWPEALSPIASRGR